MTPKPPPGTAPDREVAACPSLNWIIRKGEILTHSHDRSSDQTKDDPAVILHTSGTTGSLKPVTLTHGYFAPTDLAA